MILIFNRLSFQADKKSNPSENHRLLIDELNAYEQKHGALATAILTKDLHVWPDYRGNRSPLADPNCKGVIAGNTLTLVRPS